MIDLKITGSRDLDFTDGEMHTVADTDEVRQAVGIELTTREGEFFDDADMGLDTEYLLGKSYNEQYAAASIGAAIRKDLRVVSVQGVTVTKDGQRSVSAEAKFTIDPTIDTATVATEVSLNA